MSDTPDTPIKHDADLMRLLSALCDDSITDTEVEKLESILRADPAARTLYRRYIDMTAELQVRSPEATQPAVSNKATAQETVPISAAGVPMYRKGYEPQPFKLRAHHFAFLAATLLVACGLAAYLLTASVDPKPDPVDPNQPPPSVATLIQHTGELRTPNGYPLEGNDYEPGVYALSSGSAEFMLTNSVNVKLRGRSRIVMHNDKNVTLTRGSASFVVPKGAVGFAVRLPDKSRIIDLGTAFDVTLDEAGRSHVVVNDGTVAWAGGGDVSLLIEAGQRAGLVNGQPVLFELPADALARYALDLPETVAIARFEPGAARLDQYLDAQITQVPPALADLPAIIPPRGAGSTEPGIGYRFTLNHPARLFLLVHDRGEFAPDGWERTEHTVAWTVSGQSLTDTVYTRLAEPGEIVIPPHTGHDTTGMHGVPHVCLIAPIPEPVEKPADPTTNPQTGATK